MSELPSSGLAVIGAGLPRTGTNSLKLALEELLGGPCYHMWEFFSIKDKEERERHCLFWQKANEGKLTKEVKEI